MSNETLTPGMKNPSRNHYLMMSVKELRREISALEAMCVAVAGSPGPRLDATLMDAHHRLQFANAAMRLRNEVH